MDILVWLLLLAVAYFIGYVEGKTVGMFADDEMHRAFKEQLTAIHNLHGDML